MPNDCMARLYIEDVEANCDIKYDITGNATTPPPNGDDPATKAPNIIVGIIKNVDGLIISEEL